MVSTEENMSRLQEVMKRQLKTAEKLLSKQRMNVKMIENDEKQLAIQSIRNMELSYKHMHDLVVQYDSMMEFSGKFRKFIYYTEFISIEFSTEQKRLFSLSDLISSLLIKVTPFT